MIGRPSRDTLVRTVSKARRRLYFQSFVTTLVRVWLVVLPVAAAAIAADQRWGGGAASIWVGALAAAVGVLCPVLWAAYRLRTPLDSALAIDEGAALKDRISSAWEFLQDGADLD
ncbi:MAG: hypothetical protein FJY92_00790, partial [Candidatus Hydrogenedentes bacterium]|nr:hypothetical protein [Candidatus Hydrogenedentota bacterium]